MVLTIIVKPVYIWHWYIFNNPQYFCRESHYRKYYILLIHHENGLVGHFSPKPYNAGYKMNHVIRKSVYDICEQQRRRSAIASAQSDQCLCRSLPG